MSRMQVDRSHQESREQQMSKINGSNYRYMYGTRILMILAGCRVDKLLTTVKLQVAHAVPRCRLLVLPDSRSRRGAAGLRADSGSGWQGG